ncbi:MAG: hypothetical protein OZ921_12470 [Sorangiineae bacterium]|nr:hypothetical protein [Sorangiineae bacterium]
MLPNGFHADLRLARDLGDLDAAQLQAVLGAVTAHLRRTPGSDRRCAG